ncbi:MAG: YhgE/Pip domain-containing protein [Berryella intestinalis]|uniref:YhgE/Pip domain-containing protein n=1 Tax=Berryella intestinalis TaxID=1531429 RepID=UPI002A74780B|nr:YhgE/Pip domain-containing protein [Berryella intestinalis]MDY3129715.1 YhgE/Pip domain-containing protein [Berryella intestinalis]
MAFKGLRFAVSEVKNNMSGGVMKVVIAAIGVIPLLYGALYLYAFMDPYQTLDTVPVAVVIEDRGAVIDGEQRNVGQQVKERLQDSDEGFQWNFVDADEAERGLEDGAYYMVATIPSDFTEKIATAETDEPERASMLVTYNEATNMLASQLGSSAWKQVRSQVSEAVVQEYWETAYGSINSGAGDLGQAVDGARQIADGAETAQDGADQLSDGAFTLRTALGTLADGLSTLSSGASELKGATSSLVAGTSKLQSGADQLSSGAGQVASGASQLKSQGTEKIANGADQLRTQGTAPLSSGAGRLREATAALPTSDQVAQLQAADTQLKEGLSSLSAKVGTSSNTDSTTLFGGVNQLASGAQQVSSGADQLKSGADALVAGIGSPGDSGTSTLYGLSNSESAAIDAALAALQSSGNTDAATQQAIAYLKGAQQAATGVRTAEGRIAAGAAGLQSGLSGLSSGAGGLSQGLASLQTNMNLLSDATGQLKSGYSTLSSTVSPLITGAPALKTAVGQLASGASQVDAKMQALAQGAGEVDANMRSLVSGSRQVADGADSAAAGAGELAGGAVKLDDGAAKLANGAQTAADGSGKVEGGAATLAENELKLADGLGDLTDGSGELASALADAQDSMRIDNVQARSEMMSSPVELDENRYTDVLNYGTGFAPYFISLALWVGALMVGFIFKPLNNRLILSGAHPVMVAFSSFMPLAVMAIIQALLLLATLQFGLRLQIDNVAAFYLIGILVALVFAALMQLIFAALKVPGRVVAIVFLMLQLTSAAGTFPIEMTPPFFQAISPFMPMTYSVASLRQAMAGLDTAAMLGAAAVLAGIGIVSFAGTVLVARAKRNVTMTDLHPAISLS